MFQKTSTTLQEGQVIISKNQYNHAVKTYVEMKCASLGEYNDVYQATDVLLLAPVIEAFREVCYETYRLDCAFYFTASNHSGDAFLKICIADLELLTEREHLDMVQK